MPVPESAPLNGDATVRSYGATNSSVDPEGLAGDVADHKAEDVDLALLAEVFLQRLREGPAARRRAAPEGDPDGAYLPILLYAAYLNSRPLHPAQISSRARLDLEQRNAAVQDALYARIAAYLDYGMRRMRWAEEEVNGGDVDPGREQPDERLVDAVSPETAVELQVEEMIWLGWKFGDRQLSVVDLLLPPYTAKPTPFLSHPLLVHSLANAWRYGPPPSTESLESRFGRTRNTLFSYITPRRSHMLSLGSHIMLLLLTLMLALSPRRWIHPYKQQSRHPHFWEGGFHCRLRTLFLVPTTVVPILAYLDSAWAFSLLTFSILPLTLLLILPHSPSLALLNPEYVPLSTLLVHVSSRGVKSAKYLVPLCVVVFVIFAWALNGDMFRGFFAIPTAAALRGSLSDASSVMRPSAEAARTAKMTYDDIPVEPGLAPFETRLMLFITLLTLILLSTAVTLVRILTPAHLPPDSHPISRQPDQWVTDYGPAIAGSARQRWAGAVRTDIVRKEIVAPLNFFVEYVVPLDSVLFLLNLLPRRWLSPRVDGWRARMQVWRDNVWVFIMGPLCFPLYLLDRLISG